MERIKTTIILMLISALGTMIILYNSVFSEIRTSHAALTNSQQLITNQLSGMSDKYSEILTKLDYRPKDTFVIIRPPEKKFKVKSKRKVVKPICMSPLTLANSQYILKQEQQRIDMLRSMMFSPKSPILIQDDDLMNMFDVDDN